MGKMSQVIYAGKQFANVTELKDAIYGHAKSVGLFVRISISHSKEVEFRCKVDSTCSFKVRGAPSGMEEIDGSWKIARKIHLQHSCDPIAHIGKDPYLRPKSVRMHS